MKRLSLALCLTSVASLASAACTKEAPASPVLPAPKVAPSKATPTASPGTNAPASAPAAGQPLAKSRYRVGDSVVYRYTGTFTAKPVLLTERIKSVTAGNVLEIEVTAKRGDEWRQWIQVVTDTPENQRASRIDALFQVDKDGVKTQLKNIQTDLYRMYEWTLPQQMDTPPQKSKPLKEQVKIAGRTYTCDVERGTNTVKGKKVTFSFRQCPDFLWTKGPSEFLTESGGAIWKVEVVSTTRP